MLVLSIPMIAQESTTKKDTKMEKKKITAGRDVWGEFAPKFAEMNDDVLFGQIWARTQVLAPRDRSLITISALFGSGVLDNSFKAHLQMGKANGITKEEITEVITQLAFYAGWPKAWAALYLAKEVYGDDAPSGTSREVLFGRGKPNDAYAKYFVGKSYLSPMVSPTKENPMAIANVTFEPGCRNNWHIHSTEQILLVVDGNGWYQEAGKKAQPLHKGDIVVIKPGIKHWHGAIADSWFSHISITADALNGKNEWLEPVSDKEYKALDNE
jgi:4-carboxymuconolactone decarboxylase